MSSFDIPPTPPDDVIYVQNNSKNVEDKIKSTKENERFGPLHLEISFIYMNTLPFPFVFWPWIQAKLGPLQFHMVGPPPPLSPVICHQSVIFWHTPPSPQR